MELVEAGRGVSLLVRDVERPVFDWIDPVLKRVVARGDTWRDAIAEHGNLLGRAIGANRRNGDEGKALVCVGRRLETNFLEIGDHWLFGAEFRRRSQRDGEVREASIDAGG